MSLLAPYGTEQEEISQTPLDVKPTNDNEMLRGIQILVGCRDSLQQESSSAIQFHVDSDCSWHSRQQMYLCHLCASESLI